MRHKITHSSARFDELLLGKYAAGESVEFLSTECQPLVLTRADKRYRVLRPRRPKFPPSGVHDICEKPSERLRRLQRQANESAVITLDGSLDLQKLCTKWTEWVRDKKFFIDSVDGKA